MNSPFFHEQAAGFAERLLKVPDDQARVSFAFRQLYQREVTAKESRQAATFIGQYPGSVEEKWAGYARVLLAANEFLFLD